MMRSTIALLAIVFLQAGRGESAPPTSTTIEDVGPSASFRSLCLALVLREPDFALDLLSDRSVEYYDALRKLANQGEALASTRQLTYEERALVSALREYAPKSVLNAPSSAEALRRALAIQDEKISPESAGQLTLERITVDGNSAVGSVVYDETLTPFLVHYVRDGGTWKIERFHLAPTFVSVLDAMGIVPEVAVQNVREGAALWESVGRRLSQF